MTAPFPRRFGAYVLHHRLASGGMGDVYLATRRGAARGTPPLVLKILLPEYVGDEVFINMFHDESRIGLRLSHPNVMGVFDLGTFDDDHFLVLEYVHGVDLRQLQERLRIGREGIPTETVLRIGLEALQGLDHAHRAKDEKGRPLNLVHRDLSPENIMVSFDGDVKILDFGIAKAEGRVAVTRSGYVKGKTGYMSPEQAMGEKVDARTDLYALALVMLELISGERRFPPNTDKFDEIHMARTFVPRPPSEFDSSIPPSVDAVFMKALAIRKQDRYQTADEFTQDLTRALREYVATSRERTERLPMMLLRHFPDRAEPFLVEEVTDGHITAPIEDPTTTMSGLLANAREGKVRPKPIVRAAGPSTPEQREATTITEVLPPPSMPEFEGPTKVNPPSMPENDGETIAIDRATGQPRMNPGFDDERTRQSKRMQIPAPVAPLQAQPRKQSPATPRAPASGDTGLIVVAGIAAVIALFAIGYWLTAR